MKVLSVASECAPLVKTGGLADVVGALPAALAAQGVEMRVLLPGYRAVMAVSGTPTPVWQAADLYGGPAQLLSARVAGLNLLILVAPHLYDRDGGPYLDAQGRDWNDNAERFAALGQAALAIAQGQAGWTPDVVQGHDWQAGFAPYFIAQAGRPVPTILTIHNIAFNGSIPADGVARLGLDLADFHPEGYEFWGQVSALKAGLVYADALTTVSPTYARELTTPAFGMGMEGVIAQRAGDLTGILNGIDTAYWDPAGDHNAMRYRTIHGKRRATQALTQRLGLPDGDGPLAIVISRLTGQKGLDLLLEVLPGFLAQGGRLALLGAGDPAMERAWIAAADRHAGVHVRIGYDEDHAHRMMAGGEAILVPSRFEPCGLTQLYGLRYGTIPVVARTGGLADTVIDANEAALRVGVATGLHHVPGSADAVAQALARLVTLYQSRDTWAAMVRNALNHPVGWDVSAARYAELYQGLVASR